MGVIPPYFWLACGFLRLVFFQRASVCIDIISMEDSGRESEKSNMCISVSKGTLVERDASLSLSLSLSLLQH